MRSRFVAMCLGKMLRRSELFLHTDSKEPANNRFCVYIHFRINRLTFEKILPPPP